MSVWIYSIVSVLIVSLIAFVGILTFAIKVKKLKKILIYLVSFSAGALFAGAFIHLLPEIVKRVGFSYKISLYVLGGIVIFFVLEKVVRWRHCHVPMRKGVRSFAYMNIIGDVFHNFIDGLIIAAAYIVSFPIGLITTIAVVLHEIPQEIGDFGVLVYGGFSRRKALLINFLSALVAVLGAIVGLVLSGFVSGIELILIPIAAGGFIYIAGSDLIPELHKETKLLRSIWALVAFVLGIGVMSLLLLIG
jgi:zinc and cadmium transporter